MNRVFSEKPLSGASSETIHQLSKSFRDNDSFSSNIVNSISKSSHEKSPNLSNIFVEIVFAIGLFCIVSRFFCIKPILKEILDHGVFRFGT